VRREDGSPVALNGYQILDRRQTVQTLNRIQDVEFQLGERLIRYESLTTFTVQVPQYQWLRDEGVLLDRRNEVRYRPVDGTFTSPTGETLSPGFRSQVGVENYRRILNNPQITGPFLRVLRWNFVWATLSVVTTFVLGLFLAILLNDPTLRFRYLYRTLLIVPYAVPGFISVLVWRGLLNTDFGVINRILASVFGSGIPWFESVFWAKFAVIGVNLWLGFPYMMIICLGALQSIPPNLYSVAEIDGASRPRQFTSITLPLVLVATGPLLVGSFAFNFNNFTVIYLLTEGRPVIGGAETPAGATDILISYTYNLAFAGRGTEYGFAAAISVVIFLIIGTLSVINFRATRTFERTGETL
jgi:ABC-type sugar transport system permease subunit